MDKLVSIENNNTPVFKGRTISTNSAGYSYILLPRSVVKHLNVAKVDFVLMPNNEVVMRPHPQ